MRMDLPDHTINVREIYRDVRGVHRVENSSHSL